MIDFSKSLYLQLGCHKKENNTYCFKVFAPNALAVSVVGDFNNWLVGHDKMENNDGVWEKEVECREGDNYRFAITTTDGVIYKLDPLGTLCACDKNANVIYNNCYKWNDGEYMAKQKKKSFVNKPLNIYEVHLGSWKMHGNGRRYTYGELAKHLVAYVKKSGYNFVKLMPLCEYFNESSLGYSPACFFAPTSRLGMPDELRLLVDSFHAEDIGVIVDVSVSGFETSKCGLAMFDGECHFEKSNKLTGKFDFSKQFVQSFVTSSATYWLSEFHFDGLCVSDVDEMLYLSDSQNKWGGTENIEAIDFLRKYTSAVKSSFPSALLVAGDNAVYPKVTETVSVGGLGFDFKMDNNCVSNILQYVESDEAERSLHVENLSLALQYAFSEKCILPLSHNLMLSKLGSLINHMIGNYDDKFEQLKTLLGLVYAHPGKMMTFMGTEIAQWNNWNENKEVTWGLLNYQKHSLFYKFVCDLNKIYAKYKPLYKNDDDEESFVWQRSNNLQNGIVVMQHIDSTGTLVAIINFSQYAYYNFALNVPSGVYTLILNSNSNHYGGTGATVSDKLDVQDLCTLNVPSQSVLYYYKGAKQ